MALDPKPQPYTKYVFRADTKAIRTFAGQVHTLGESGPNLHTFVHRYLTVSEPASGFANRLGDLLTQIEKTLEPYGDRITDMMTGSAIELSRAARMYDQLDEATAAKYDRLYSTKPANL